MPFTTQANLNGASKTYNYVCLSTQCQVWTVITIQGVPRVKVTTSGECSLC